MRPRTVDWSIFLLVTFQAITGLVTLLTGRWAGRWVFYLHGVAGLALVVLLFWKFRRVLRRLTRPALWDVRTTVSAAASLTVLATLATGVVWATIQWPAGWPSGMNLHILLALALAPLYLVHMALRWKPPSARDFAGRRNALRFLGTLMVGAAAWGLQAGLNRLGDTPGAGRRFTGSSQTGSDSGNDFPVTSWMLDNPAPVDRAAWRLRVHGAVEREHSLTYAQVVGIEPARERAVLDCTGGWYTIQNWGGVRMAWLLDQVAPRPDAVAVSFKSVTGYRWSLPLAEARGALLATHVGAEPLSHGHGAPLRLVTPGRRGFQWVKWVEEVEVLTGPDYRQWLEIFTSGLPA
jgi:DMSO/TMAO reductase YedYZ molybdopterin-dependent catalytic subunit